MSEENDQSQNEVRYIALLGNPNSGKTSVFNQLTGLHQKTGNFPGVTVDKKIGKLFLPDGRSVTLVDFPGTYSLYPTGLDERVVVRTLSNPNDENYPDAILYIADATRLEKHLLLFTQLQSLGIPILLGLNMSDLIKKSGIEPDLAQLSKDLSAPVVLFSGRTGEGIDALKVCLQKLLDPAYPSIYKSENNYSFSKEEEKVIAALKIFLPCLKPYQILLNAHHHEWLPHLSAAQRINIKQILDEHQFKPLHFQVRETMQRYNKFLPVVHKVLRHNDPQAERRTDKIDRIIT
ncbi:MAG TPA: ferrous iron transporter B, partial [Phaeodactylibacter sp.]|nr:ferrous iron transporter B [Phaeodactylibacter sp.]